MGMRGLTYLFNNGVSFKGKFVVVIQVCELLLGDLDTTIRNIIDTALLEDIIKHVTLIIEPCCANFAAVIQQVHAE